MAKNSHCRLLWQEKLLLNKSDENKMLSILKDAAKQLKSEDLTEVWNFILDNVESNVVVSLRV